MGDAIPSPTGMDILMQIVQLALPYLLPVIVALGMYVYSHLPLQKQAKLKAQSEYIQGLAGVVVRAVEMTSKGLGSQDKYTKAEAKLTQRLQQAGLAVTPLDMKDYIESAVQVMRSASAPASSALPSTPDAGATQLMPVVR